MNDLIKERQEELDRLEQEHADIDKVTQEMTDEHLEMSQHQVYQKYSYLTMEDIQQALGNISLKTATQRDDLLLDQVIGQSQD